MSRKKQSFYNNYDTRNIKPSNMQAQDNPSTVDNILKQVQKEQDNSGKWTKQSTKLINSAGTLMNNGKKNGDISDIIDYFRTENNLLIPQDGNPSIIGTSMPFQYNLFSDIILNPSSVSTTEFQKIAYGDPVVYSGLMYTSTVVADMIGDFRHPNKEVSDLVNFNLENMEISKVQLIKFILSALWAGFSIQEKVYGVKRFKGRSRVLITDTVQLPPSSIIFRVDTSGKLKDDGIVQYYYNNLWTGYANMLSFNSYNQGGNVSTPNPYAKKGDLDTPLRSVWAQPIGTVILPKRKCIHHVFAGLDGFTSPYGRSILRSTYSYWVQKQALLQISLIAANYKASPIPIKQKRSELKHRVNCWNTLRAFATIV